MAGVRTGERVKKASRADLQSVRAWLHAGGPIHATRRIRLDSRDGRTGTELVRDYFRAKGDEPYAGMPSSRLRATIGLTLQNLIPHQQPLLFDSLTILNERWPWGPNGYPSESVRSATWDEAYEAFKRGELLPLPHYETRPTDSEKQAALTLAYERYRAGEVAAEDLPDLADIFPDDAQVRAELGLVTEPDGGARHGREAAAIEARFGEIAVRDDGQSEAPPSHRAEQAAAGCGTRDPATLFPISRESPVGLRSQQEKYRIQKYDMDYNYLPGTNP